MIYNTLESAARKAICKTIGAGYANFDRHLMTCDPDEDISLENVDLGTRVELSFDGSVSPFPFFSSDVFFYVNAPTPTTPALIQLFLGNYCSDIEAAEKAAAEFLERDDSYGWYIEDCFDENCGLHLIRTLGFNFENESDFSDALENCFSELCQSELSEMLTSFVRYFED